jgi:outer membrane receptor for ferrienterochelin and colicin
LLVSYAGYEADTLTWQGRDEVVVTLQPKTLADVEISRRKKATRISAFDPMQTRIIGEGELLKAACCNLSESFETSPSVDVAFTDAVTGTRQIQMLGLAGPYTQITRENMPSVRGLSAMYGLTYVPGTWVESIQLNKGTGSVVNGYEAIAGQLNVELRKPETADRAYVNGYANVMGRLEGNVNLAHRLDSTGWSTALLLHASTNPLPNDRNQDGFLDNPLGTSFIGLHRWKYAGAKGLRFQAGVNGTYVDQQGGQVAFDPDRDDPSQDRWGMQLQTRQLAGWAKLGKVFPQHPWRSVGLQLSVAHHQQHSYFGPNQYDGQQQSAYANFVYQGILGNSNHTFRTGASLLYDDYAERFNQQDFTRMEVVPGAYFEYTYQFLTRFSAVAGLRADYHNLYGAFITPRLHVRYAPTDQTVIRASLGRGQRTASILAENNGLLASSRQVLIEGETPGLPYGLSPEIAWNFGLNLTQDFRLDYRDGQVTVDAYRTEFVNQIVIDRDRSPQQVAFYNLSGRSFSNSVQAQVDYELLKFLDLRLAYRWLDVRTTYDGVLLSKPLIPTHRAFLNLAYATREDWVFDLTVNWQGSQRLPSTASNPEPYRLATRSPSVILVNAQVSKQWGDHWEVYLGGENLLDQRQERPILSAEAPFSDYFDSSVVWGPIFGRNVYLGFRYRLK